MARKNAEFASGRYGSDAARREQKLCVDAMHSGDYDDMTDAEWVLMCEQLAREGKAALLAAHADATNGTGNI